MRIGGSDDDRSIPSGLRRLTAVFAFRLNCTNVTNGMQMKNKAACSTLRIESVGSKESAKRG